MSFQMKTLVLESCTNPGTGDFLLAGPGAARRSWLTLGAGNKGYYCAMDSVDAEWGICTVVAGTPNRLTRDTVIGNSQGTTSKINFSGPIVVFETLPAEYLPFTDPAGQLRGLRDGSPAAPSLPISESELTSGWYRAAAGTARFARLGVDLLEMSATGFKILGDGLATGALSAGSVISAGDVRGTSLNGGPLGGARNRLINGGFTVWQRGSSITDNSAALKYGPDRWQLLALTGGTMTASRQAFTSGQTAVPGNPASFARFQCSVAPSSGGNPGFRQKIEAVLAGAHVCSFWAKAAVAGDYHVSGGGVWGGTTTYGTPQVIQVTTAWKKFEVALDFPVSGLAAFTGTFDSSNCSGLMITASSARTYTLDIASVQLEAGPVATVFEYRHPGDELAACQRYYQTVQHEQNFYASVAGEVMQSPILLPTPMRVTPTISVLTAGSAYNVFVPSLTAFTSTLCAAAMAANATGQTSITGRVYAADGEL